MLYFKQYSQSSPAGIPVLTACRRTQKEKFIMVTRINVSYKKLWHLLLDRNMKKKDLEKAAKLTHYQMAKLSSNKAVTTDVLGNICRVLGCRIEDIVEFVDGGTV